MRDATYYARPQVQGLLPPAERGAEWCPLMFWTAPVPFDAAAKVGGEPVHALANHGRWVVSCPDCGGAQLACLTDPRFMCCECANVGNGGQWRPVAFPRNAAAIADLLEQRPVRLQNTDQGQTLKHIRAENKALGVKA